MTTPISDPLISPIAADLVVCLTAEAAKVPNPPASPRVVCLRPGDRVDLLISQTEDECCSGLMWVRWVRAYPSGQNTFPTQDDRVSPCRVLRWAVQFELGAVRCAPTPDPESLPSCDEWTDVTLGVYDDGAAIRRAICCYAQSHEYDALVLQEDGRPLTTEGGCVGVAYLVTISGPACDCQGASTL